MGVGVFVFEPVVSTRVLVVRNGVELVAIGVLQYSFLVLAGESFECLGLEQPVYAHHNFQH